MNRRNFLKLTSKISLGGLISLFIPARLLAKLSAYQFKKDSTAGDPVELTKDNIAEYIVNCGKVLDEQRTIEQKQWGWIPISNKCWGRRFE